MNGAAALTNPSLGSLGCRPLKEEPDLPGGVHQFESEGFNRVSPSAGGRVEARTYYPSSDGVHIRHSPPPNK